MYIVFWEQRRTCKISYTCQYVYESSGLESFRHQWLRIREILPKWTKKPVTSSLFPHRSCVFLVFELSVNWNLRILLMYHVTWLDYESNTLCSYRSEPLEWLRAQSIFFAYWPIENERIILRISRMFHVFLWIWADAFMRFSCWTAGLAAVYTKVFENESHVHE